MKNKIITAFSEQAEETDSNAARDRIADALAQAIVDEIKFLKINYTNGLTAGSTPVTGNINHTVS